MYEHETPPASLVISIFMLQYTFVCSTPKHLTFLYPKKSLCFFGQLSDRCHNSSKVFYEAFIKLCHCNQKERVRKYTAQRLPSTNPGVHVLLNYSTQTSENTQLTNCLLNHHKIKDVQELCSHTTTEQMLQHTSPASPIHTDVNKRKLSHYIIDYTHSESTSLLPVQCSQKHQLLSVVYALSLSSLCSSLINCQAQQKVLAFNQTILTNKAFHGYVLKDHLFCPYRSADHRPQNSSSQKSDSLIFCLATICPCFSLHSQPSFLHPNLLSSWSSFFKTPKSSPNFR
jgi:hypothetical protein